MKIKNLVNHLSLLDQESEIYFISSVNKNCNCHPEHRGYCLCSSDDCIFTLDSLEIAREKKKNIICIRGWEQ